MEIESPVPQSFQLPPQPTRLIDREAELTPLGALLSHDEIRLLTLTGPGGVGKTRLAIAAAERVRERFPAGIWFVDLTPLADPALVLPTIARELGVRDVTGQDLAETLATFLGDRLSLLLLDNFEHVLAAAAAIETLLAACPRLTIVATSREPLHLRREQVVEVPPLPIPSAQRASWTVAGLAALPAIAFFVDRAQAANADFALSERNAAAVAELSRHLDGLPLAMELAAARTRVLEPSALLARMEHSLSLLRWDAPDLPPRHRTLRATLDWSYALLSPEEQSVFRRLGVFAGGFTLEAVAAVAATDELGVESLEAMQGLADKHLVRVLARAADEEPRFGLLATMRDYALERLAESRESEGTRDRHLAFYLALAEQADRAMLGPGEIPWLNRLDREMDNLRLAHEWAISRGDVEGEWRLVAALAMFWVLRGYLREGTQWVEAALSRAYDPDRELRARFLKGAGLLAHWSGRGERAITHYEGSLVAAKAADSIMAAPVLGLLGTALYAQGNVARARAVIAEMLTLARAADAGLLIGYALVTRILFAIGPHGSEREREQLRTELDEPVERLRKAGERRTLAVLLACRARLLVYVDAAAAHAALREALTLGQGVDAPLMFSILPWLAMVLLAERLPAEQLARLAGGMAALAALGATVGGRTAIDLFGAPQDRAVLEQAVTRARETLGEEAFANAEATGRVFAFDELLDALLAALAEGEGALSTGIRAGSSSPQTGSLISPREREVLALVVHGRPNKAIAKALFVSPSTVKTHVSSLLTKLDADNRAQLTTIAMQRGLLRD